MSGIRRALKRRWEQGNCVIGFIFLMGLIFIALIIWVCGVGVGSGH